MKINSKIGRLAGVSVLAASAVFSMAGAARADVGMNFGTGNSTFSYVNPSASSASVSVVYYKPDGSVELAPAAVTATSLKRIDVTLGSGDALVGVNFSGSVILSSDQDLVAVAATRYTAHGSVGNGYEEELAVYPAFNQGATKLYAPQLTRVSGTNNNVSRLALQNTTGSVASVGITFYYGGVSVARPLLSIPAYGSVLLSMGTDADISPATWSGTASAVITSTQALAGIVERHWNVPTEKQNWVASYPLLTDESASSTLLSPAAFRTCVAANCINTVASSFNAYSSYLIQNATNVTNTITIAVTPRGGAQLAQTIVKALAPFGTFVWNPFNNNGLPLPLDPQFAAMGNSFSGSARITSSAGNIVAVGYTFNPLTAPSGQNTAGAYKLIPQGFGTSTLLAPRYGRLCTLCVVSNIADHSEFGNIQILNTGATTVTLASIEFINANGTTQFTLNAGNQATYLVAPQTLALGGGGSFAINSRTVGSFVAAQLSSALGSNFNGWIRVTGPGGATLASIVAVSRGEKGSDIYNAFNR